jgi:hypothetical protein
MPAMTGRVWIRRFTIAPQATAIPHEKTIGGRVGKVLRVIDG